MLSNAYLGPGANGAGFIHLFEIIEKLITQKSTSATALLPKTYSRLRRHSV